MTVFDVPRNANIQTYTDAKLEILTRDFKITLTVEEITKANKLKTETQVNQFCLGIINKRWN